MQSNEILLEVMDLNKTFPVKKEKLYAVNHVSFSLQKGECLGIVGESGCGKSTLAKMLVGSLPVSSGKMELSGVDYAALKGKERRAFRKKIQMVFQDPLSSFSPRMKIGTYLAEPRRNYDKVSKQQSGCRVIFLCVTHTSFPADSCSAWRLLECWRSIRSF